MKVILHEYGGMAIAVLVFLALLPLITRLPIRQMADGLMHKKSVMESDYISPAYRTQMDTKVEDTAVRTYYMEAKQLTPLTELIRLECEDTELENICFLKQEEILDDTMENGSLREKGQKRVETDDFGQICLRAEDPGVYCLTFSYRNRKGNNICCSTTILVNGSAEEEDL